MCERHVWPRIRKAVRLTLGGYLRPPPAAACDKSQAQTNQRDRRWLRNRRNIEPAEDRSRVAGREREAELDADIRGYRSVVYRRPERC